MVRHYRYQEIRQLYSVKYAGRIRYRPLSAVSIPAVYGDQVITIISM